MTEAIRLHIDNSTAPNHSDPDYNKLWKIQPLITALQSTCAECIQRTGNSLLMKVSLELQAIFCSIREGQTH